MKRRSSRQAATVTVSVDVVLLGCHDRRLHAVIDAAGKRASLPSDIPRKHESLDGAASRVIREATGSTPDWLEQLGAFTDAPTHLASGMMSVGYVGLLPFDGAPTWKAVDRLSGLPERQRRMVSEAVRAIQRRLAMEPVVFSLLPGAFSLSQLQATYETLLGRRLYKASFRRALMAAHLVVPTGDMRSEGRGRPAQLFRFAPRRRKQLTRGIRFYMP